MSRMNSAGAQPLRFCQHRVPAGKQPDRKAGALEVMADQARNIRVVFYDKDARFHEDIVAGVVQST